MDARKHAPRPGRKPPRRGPGPVTTEPARVRLAGRDVGYLLKRSARRRTVSLAVDAERGLIVYCPRRFGRARLEALLREKARWILDKTAQAEHARARRDALRWRPGAALPYLGERYPLQVQPNGRGSDLRLEGECLRLYVPDGAARTEATGAAAAHPDEARLREAAIAGYKAAARREITARVERFAARLGVTPARVSIRSQRRRWGSCSARGTLSFNWRLVLAPAAVMDYVVVHELCHLLVLNHSPRFWAHVAALLPGYAEQRRWLREHGATLFI